MTRILKVYRPDGTTRAIWSDAIAASLRKHDVIPQRASRVEAITEGPHRGKFHVDLSLLASIAKNAKFEVCLTKTFESYAEAVAAEVKFIELNWVLEGVGNGQENPKRSGT